jgi:hypothetical protein
MTKVKPAIEDQKINTVTLIWMQGERDARVKHGKVYSESLKRLRAQLTRDLNHENSPLRYRSPM